jgi:hypothetical protein
MRCLFTRTANADEILVKVALTKTNIKNFRRQQR